MSVRSVVFPAYGGRFSPGPGFMPNWWGGEGCLGWRVAAKLVASGWRTVDGLVLHRVEDVDDRLLARIPRGQRVPEVPANAAQRNAITMQSHIFERRHEICHEKCFAFLCSHRFTRWNDSSRGTHEYEYE